MKNKQIKLTESELHDLIVESVNGILNEIGVQQPAAGGNGVQQAQGQQQQMTAFQQSLAKYLTGMARAINTNYQMLQRIEKGVNALWDDMSAMQRRH